MRNRVGTQCPLVVFIGWMSSSLTKYLVELEILIIVLTVVLFMMKKLYCLNYLLIFYGFCKFCNFFSLCIFLLLFHFLVSHPGIEEQAVNVHYNLSSIWINAKMMFWSRDRLSDLIGLYLSLSQHDQWPGIMRENKHGD